MTRRSKSAALIRDVAQLFVTYELVDWQPLIEELHDGSALQRRVASVIEELAAAAPRRAPKPTSRKATPKTTAKQSKPKRLHPERSAVLDALEAELKSRHFLSDARALKEAFVRTGAKGAPPKNRAAAIAALLERLDQMPFEQFTSLVEAIQQSGGTPPRDFNGDYGRWFSLILDRAPMPASLRDVHTEILSLMDRALVRGARHFSRDDESKLQMERDRWERSGGSSDGVSIIEKFLFVVANARHASASDTERKDMQVYEIKAQWRDLLRRVG